jgi:hypothetical protein
MRELPELVTTGYLFTASVAAERRTQADAMPPYIIKVCVLVCNMCMSWFLVLAMSGDRFSNH